MCGIVFNVGFLASNSRNYGKIDCVVKMLTLMENSELHENTDQSVSLYELLRNDIEGKEMLHSNYKLQTFHRPSNENIFIPIGVPFV
jgi:hypothetical protein